MKNVEKILSFLSSVIIPISLQAMVYHRIECGFIQVKVYEEKIIATNEVGTRVGELVYHIHNRMVDTKKLEIVKIAVDENYQRRGIGTRLVKAAETRAQTKECESLITLTNKTSKPFWGKIGFAQPDSKAFVFCKKVLKSKL